MSFFKVTGASTRQIVCLTRVSSSEMSEGPDLCSLREATDITERFIAVAGQCTC